MRTARLAIALVMFGAPAGGCADRSEREGAPLPKPTPVVTVTMTDFRFDLDDERVPSGRVVFRVRNAGRRPHRVTLLPLPEDFPPIDAQLRGNERRPVEPFAGMPERRRGETGSFAVDLEPGRRYGIVCFTIDPDNQSHAQKGMSTEFRTTGRVAPKETPSGTAPPSSDATNGDEGL